MAQARLSSEYSTISTPYNDFNRMPLNRQWRGGRNGRISEDRDPCCTQGRPLSSAAVKWPPLTGWLWNSCFVCFHQAAEMDLADYMGMRREGFTWPTSVGCGRRRSSAS